MLSFEPKCWERKCSGSEDCEPKNFANSCLAYPTSDISKWRVSPFDVVQDMADSYLEGRDQRKNIR
ncbi:hypothetical protein C5167_035324 [Papaver somniferum]|uniref:Uncharacterized protein n=1 Tax=Papaver somniferum TaxID=3469 RepID=A0A4Y7KID5_PAPSO|nr:hypothetical protein C5167_035324 [Papaver somniferum]